MIYTLNTQTPAFKQDEYNAHQIKINVPQGMQGFNLFVVFALPSGRKIFTPRLDLSSGAVTYQLSKGITSEVGRVTVELQGYYNDKYIKSITYSFNVVASLTTDDDPDQADFMPWYLETVKLTEENRAAKAKIEGYVAQLPVKADKSYTDAQLALVNADITALETDKADKADTYTKAQVDDKDALLVPKTTTINTKALSGNISLAAADVPNTPAGGILATNVQSALNELDTEKANKVQEGWITPTLLNGWSGDVKYRKNNFGNVEFRGKITGGTSAIAFTLPVGYRPTSDEYLLGSRNSPSAFITIVIQASGNVSVVTSLYSSQHYFTNVGFNL